MALGDVLARYAVNRGAFSNLALTVQAPYLHLYDWWGGAIETRLMGGTAGLTHVASRSAPTNFGGTIMSGGPGNGQLMLVWNGATGGFAPIALDGNTWRLVSRVGSLNTVQGAAWIGSRIGLMVTSGGIPELFEFVATASGWTISEQTGALAAVQFNGLAWTGTEYITMAASSAQFGAGVQLLRMDHRGSPIAWRTVLPSVVGNFNIDLACDGVSVWGVDNGANQIVRWALS